MNSFLAKEAGLYEHTDSKHFTLGVKETLALPKEVIDERFGDDPSRIQLVRCGHDPALAGKTIKDLLVAAKQPLTQGATADTMPASIDLATSR